ncbi:hypothetical protein [Caulobacter endophyticus]|uniref:Uncharacterized protein n=1 Tax=Caulobacter endophyticus TaxID=2172652 RepID=A0A2T9K4P6_9CAUL|nr:hypothetical protein [Caulobacter endophyticus]PVM90946.1 hypothetical protein DDF67_08300 [Caulobacter endophyticus]
MTRLYGWLPLCLALGLTQAALAGEAHDEWRHVPARGATTARAEMVREGFPPIFVASCEAPKVLKFVFSTKGDDEPDPRRWSAGSYLDIDLILTEPGVDREERLVMKGQLKRGSITGRLTLTPVLARHIASASMIALYAENGPTNNFDGGEARALRRLVLECAGEPVSRPAQ